MLNVVEKALCNVSERLACLASLTRRTDRTNVSSLRRVKLGIQKLDKNVNYSAFGNSWPAANSGVLK